jgi:nitroreductase
VFASADRILADAGVLDLATDHVTVMVALGYRAVDPKRPTTRRPLSEVVRMIGG